MDVGCIRKEKTFSFKPKTSAFEKNTQFSMDLSGNANKRVETLSCEREPVVSSGLACVGWWGGVGREGKIGAEGKVLCIFFNQKICLRECPSPGWPHL